MATYSRHITNTSNKPWHFYIGPMYGGAILVAPNGEYVNNCVLRRCERAEIRFWDLRGHEIEGTLQIVDHLDQMGSWPWKGTDARCPRFDHDGDTGPVVFNDPLDGDVKLWLPSWNG